MKVAIVYEFTNPNLWSTPNSVVRELQSRGYKVDSVHLLDEQKLVQGNYDLVIVMDWKGIDISHETKRILKSRGTYLVRENADTPQNYEKHISCMEVYDLILTPDYKSHLDYQLLGYNCMHWPHFADSTIHKVYYPYDTIEAKVRSTRGPGGSWFLDRLSEVMGPDKFLNKNGLYGEEYGRFLGCAKITVQNSRFGEVTRRLFEGMGCASMVLADRLSKDTRIYDMFTEGKHIVYYNSLPECISLINYYTSREGEYERFKIAAAGYSLVQTNHTQKQRVDDILAEYFKKL
jgi:hypothetical protein